MSTLTCKTCGTTWEGSAIPKCPNCLAQSWASSPKMVRPKHDPGLLPSASPSFRSVVPDDFLQRPIDYFQHIAISGTALYSQKHGGYCYVVGMAPHLTAGSAIPPQSAMPTRPMDAFLIAKPFGIDAHIFAEDDAKIQVEISQGGYVWPPTCSEKGCNNLCYPGEQFCAKHLASPQAT